MAFAACASADAPVAPYDEVAQIVGADAAAPGGDVAALADAVVIAHGALPTGFARDNLGYVRGDHSGVHFLYLVTCRDAAGKPMVCGQWSASAEVIDVRWGVLRTPELTASVRHEGTWTLRGLATATAYITGESFVTYATGATYFTANQTDTLVADLGTLALTAGAMEATSDVTRHDAQAGDEQFPVTSTLVVEHGRSRIDLDGTNAYWLDVTTGKVTAAAIVE